MLWDDQAVQDALDGKPAPTKAPPAPAGDAPLGGPGAFAGGRPGESERPAEVLGKQLKISNRGALEAARNWGEKSDILRYEILAQVCSPLPMSCEGGHRVASISVAVRLASTRIPTIPTTS